MEITNEIRRKIFGQYLGCKFYMFQWAVPETKTLNGVVGSYAVCGYDNHFFLDTTKLILKPLSSITDEDAKEVALICSVYDATGHLTVSRYSHRVIVYSRLQDNGEAGKAKVNICFNEYEVNYLTENGYSWPDTYRAFEIYQFLQSKGYDLPQYLLGGKTLKEAGIAIYKEDLK